MTLMHKVVRNMIYSSGKCNTAKPDEWLELEQHPTSDTLLDTLTQARSHHLICGQRLRGAGDTWEMLLMCDQVYEMFGNEAGDSTQYPSIEESIRIRQAAQRQDHPLTCSQGHAAWRRTKEMLGRLPEDPNIDLITGTKLLVLSDSGGWVYMRSRSIPVYKYVRQMMN